MFEGNVTMLAKDTVSSRMAQILCTIGDNRYNFASFISFEAKVKKNKTTVAILGKSGDGNKANGWSGTFSGKLHYNTSIFRKMMLDYIRTGQDMYFEIQVTNEDETSSAGRQTIIYTGCNLDEITMSKFDASGSAPLDEDVSGTFEDCTMPEEFNLLDGMLLS